MLCLIRSTTTNPDGIFESSDTELDTDKLTVGSAPDQSIQLLSRGVSQQHAVITHQRRGDLLGLECIDGKVEFGGQLVRSCKLKVGDSVRIAGNKLARIEAPLGLDVAVQVFPGEDSAAVTTQTAFESPQEIAKGKTILWSCALFLVILVASLVLPLLSSVNDAASLKIQALHLPTDRFWLSGPLLNAHQFPAIASDCGVCHTQAWQMVQDSSCEGCHSGMGEHTVDPAWRQHPAIQRRCASCHKEHNEPAQIFRRDDAFCVQCHSDSQLTLATRSDLKPVVNFSEQGHPEFRLALLTAATAAGAGGWQVERSRQGEPALVERSNLKFPHDLHLDGDRVQSLATGNTLDCVDCHQLSGDKEHFIPITMETTCRGCHSLSFDSPNPTRELPHAAPQIVINAMEEYFVKFYASPENQDPQPPPWRRRVPGKKYEYRKCAGSPYECGIKQAQLEAARQLEVTGCVTCHEVTRSQSGGDKAAWSVAPVKLTDDWFKFGKFNHAVHTQAVAPGDPQGCQSCHDAQSSNSSADILLPGKQRCLICHSAAQSPSVDLNCINCHRFHISDIVTVSDAR